MEKSAKGVSGTIIQDCYEGPSVFRVAQKDGSFKDYEIYYHDLTVTINDEDAVLKEENGQLILDYSKQTLAKP